MVWTVEYDQFKARVDDDDDNNDGDETRRDDDEMTKKGGDILDYVALMREQIKMLIFLLEFYVNVLGFNSS